MPSRRIPIGDGEPCQARDAWVGEYLSAWPQCSLPREVAANPGPSLRVDGLPRLDLDVMAVLGAPDRRDLPQGCLPRLLVRYVQAWLAEHPEDGTAVPLGEALVTWLRDACGLAVRSRRSLAAEVARLTQCAWVVATAPFPLSDHSFRIGLAAPGSESACFEAVRAGKVPGELKVSAEFASLARRSRAVLDEGRLREVAGDSLVLDIYVWIPFWVVRRRSLVSGAPETTAGWSLLIQTFGLGGVASERVLQRRLAHAFRQACEAWDGVLAESCSRGITLRATPGFSRSAKFSWPQGRG